MDALTTLGTLTLLAACLAGIAVSGTLGITHELVPSIAYRGRLRTLKREVVQLAAEYVPPGEPRHRHNAHCPACGRFARVTSAGEWGVRTRCKAHGIRLRAVKLIGQSERHLIRVTTYRAPLAETVPTTTGPVPIMVEAIAPQRAYDWLDAVQSRHEPETRRLAHRPARAA